MFTKINAQERNALIGLPHLQIVLYVLALKSRIDFSTGTIGKKYRVSWQGLLRDLHVEPIFGRKGQSITISKIRTAAAQLERRGLIEIVSDKKHLIIKCLLVELIDSKNTPDNQQTYSDNLEAKIAGDSIENSMELDECDETAQSSRSRNIQISIRDLRYKEKPNTNVLVKKKNSITKKSQLPELFTVTENHLSMARQNGWPNPNQEIGAFRDYHLARGTVFKDWDRAFYTWLRNSKRFNQSAKQGNVSRREQAMLDTIATCIPEQGYVYEQ